MMLLCDQVWFLPSFSDAQRAALLAKARAVVYTPQNEHFGIVPLEAMAAARPVIACNSGGPRESVKNGVTGFLVKPNARSFAHAMATFVVSLL
jgi:alpha-1,3/alpha-1,6-mannosyltransferase